MSDDPRNEADNPGVVAPPPLIYAGALIIGLLVNRLRPIPFLPRTLGRVLGPSLIVGGILIGTFGFREMRRAGTNVDPYKPATTVVQNGPYRYTRNPLYVGMTMIYGGVTARANALPAALLLPAVLHVMQHGVIDREERYLERKFGDEYLNYKSRVRRWI
ncbi:MAG TPA: isoprenylcysteine carboxylmethyltransferase family protein [Rubrobacteraceae bacterium]|nr:isoprenylcysteine carboxylmethyltransferase family protein [Rubrobacteraceae bacterium]